jgi:predicted amino acid dehydrogenase
MDSVHRRTNSHRTHVRNGQLESEERTATEITDGTVMVMGITTDLTEGIHRTTAGKLAKSALEHLRRVRQSIGQPAPPPED